MRKTPKQRAKAKMIVLMILAVTAVAVALSSNGFAAQARQNTTTASIGRVTILDPFALRTVALSSAPSTSRLAASAAALRFGPSTSWRPVRVPVRLPERSAFRPSLSSSR